MEDTWKRAHTVSVSNLFCFVCRNAEYVWEQQIINVIVVTDKCNLWYTPHTIERKGHQGAGAP